jgi:subtilisin family serine protease
LTIYTQLWQRNCASDEEYFAKEVTFVFVSPEQAGRGSAGLGSASSPLDLVKLTPLMHRSSGAPDIMIGLIDGPVALEHTDLNAQNIRVISHQGSGNCSNVSSVACVHGTFVAGILAAKRGSTGLAICPGCTLLVRSIFAETSLTEEPVPSATPAELADAIWDLVEAGAHIINLSLALVQSARGGIELGQALDLAARKGVIVVASAGNQGLSRVPLLRVTRGLSR